MKIQFEDVSVSFNTKSVFEHVTVNITEGDFVSLIGETGVGKTTLMRLLYFDLLPTKGTVTVGSFSSERIRRKEIPQLRQMIGIAFQEFNLLDDRNIFENTALPLEILSRSNDFIEEQVLKTLTDVGMLEKKDAMPFELAGGERQRAALARAMVNQPGLLLVDEPTGNLDPATAMEILGLLKQIHEKGTTIIMASHNYDVVRGSGSRILQLKDGKVEEVAGIS